MHSGVAGAYHHAPPEGVEQLFPLVEQLTSPDTREQALLELSKRREAYPDLAPILWHSCGTIAALLQEIVSIYSMLSPATLSPGASNRVCNALALLQCVASHTDTKTLLLNAHVPLYLYPFLNTVSKQRPFEYLRLTSLGVIGALVKVDDREVVHFLLQTEIIPLCLRIMETGSELSKTVATFIVQKILLDELGLNYMCATAERFYAVNSVLSSMVMRLVEQPSVRLLKHIVRCYLRLSEHPRARDALRVCLPDALRNNTFLGVLQQEENVRQWLGQLVANVQQVQVPVSASVAAPPPPHGGVGVPQSHAHPARVAQGGGMPGGMGHMAGAPPPMMGGGGMAGGGVGMSMGVMMAQGMQPGHAMDAATAAQMVAAQAQMAGGPMDPSMAGMAPPYGMQGQGPPGQPHMRGL